MFYAGIHDLTSYSFVDISQRSEGTYEIYHTPGSHRTRDSNYDAYSCENLKVLHAHIIFIKIIDTILFSDKSLLCS
jgi:hypothetical protein